jgi:hypothetical protein
MVALRVQATGTQRTEVSELVYVRAARDRGIDVADDDRRAVAMASIIERPNNSSPPDQLTAS